MGRHHGLQHPAFLGQVVCILPQVREPILFRRPDADLDNLQLPARRLADCVEEPEMLVRLLCPTVCGRQQVLVSRYDGGGISSGNGGGRQQTPSPSEYFTEQPFSIIHDCSDHNCRINIP